MHGPWRTTALVLLVQLAIVAAVIVLWQIAADTKFINPFFFGQPSGILASALKVIRDGTLLSHLWVTLAETLLAFVTGMLIGSAAGLALWWSRFWARVFDPFLVLFNALPKIALAPMFVVWFGVGFGMKVALAFSLVAVIACMVAYDGTKQVDGDLHRMLVTLGASKRQVFFKLVLPSCLPWIFSALRMCIGFALLGCVVGEFISASQGLGYLISNGSATYELNLVWVALITLLLLSALLQMAGGWLERRLLRHEPRR
jgi:NitT/TauT family transport system permease protein